MRAYLHTCSAARSRLCRHLAALTVGLLALTLPAVAGASVHIKPTTQPTPATASVHTALVEVPTGDLQTLLASLPVSDLGLTQAQLATLLTNAGGGSLSGETSTLTTLLSSLLTAHPSATLGELSSTVQSDPVLGLLLTLAGKELTPATIAAALSPEELSTLLANLTSGADTGQLEQLLSGLAGTLTPEQQATLKTILGALAEGLPAEGLAKLRTALAALPTGLSEGELAGLSPAQLAGVVDELFTTATPTQLAPVVNDLLSGLALGSGTAGSLATTLGVPLQTLASSLDETGGEDFSALPTLTGTLGQSGQVVGLLDRTRGLAHGLLTH
jgi:hypothetical protein